MKTNINYLKETLKKIENTTKEADLSAIEKIVNSSSLKWSDADKMIINARIQDVREFWAGLTPSKQEVKPLRNAVKLFLRDALMMLAILAASIYLILVLSYDGVTIYHLFN